MDQKLPSPKQVEEIMLQKDKQAAKETNPLDSHASFFYLYIFRFHQQIKFMSKKQLLRLVRSLVGSPYTQELDVNKLLRIGNTLNLNSLIRTIGNSVEFPLNEKEIKTFSAKEKEFFHLMDNLIADKYVGCIEEIKDPKDVKVIQDVIKHSHDEKEFKKREQVEKDAFSTANQLLCSKTLLIQYTVLEELKTQEDKKKEGETNGKREESQDS